MPNDSLSLSRSAPSARVHDGTPLSQLLVGQSPQIAHVRALIERAAPTKLSVLIQGPTGAGKEVVASALHAASARRGGFVAFNVCALGDSMFEDALFGHVRGAFTGAASDVPGLLREADGGTLFLDEIGALPLAMQVKLLRAIETRRFRPVGARMDVVSDFRVVSATNDDLSTRVERREFRGDLAQRLGAIVIHIPALAERREDIAPLAYHFLRQAQQRHTIADDAIAMLEDYSWPGNARELKQVMEWAAMWSASSITREAIASALATRFGAPLTPNNSSRERQLLLETLDAHSWEMDAVAGALKVHRATVYRLMRRFDLSIKRRRAQPEPIQ